MNRYGKELSFDGVEFVTNNVVLPKTIFLPKTYHLNEQCTITPCAIKILSLSKRATKVRRKYLYGKRQGAKKNLKMATLYLKCIALGCYTMSKHRKNVLKLFVTDKKREWSVGLSKNINEFSPPIMLSNA